MNTKDMASPNVELTILMPCLNEAETLATCIGKARAFLRDSGVEGEVLIADNGSTDGSIAIAEDLGARVVHVPVRGYGATLGHGIENARGRFVIMGDADDSYDFSSLMPFVEELRGGADLVMGNRFKGGIKPGAMPFLHRWLGNPVLSFLGRLFFHAPIGDFHCGLRGFRRDAILALDLNTTGMEFASEMVVKSALHKLDIREVPVVLWPDGRSRPPHLRTWRDGWRHLRFLLLHSPRWLFLLPGLFLLLASLAGMALIYSDMVMLGKVGLDIHTMAYLGVLALMGLQMVLFAVFTKMMGMIGGWLPDDDKSQQWLRWITLERCIALAMTLALVAAVISVFAFAQWSLVGYGALDPRVTMRSVIPAVTLLSFSGEIFLAGFFVEAIRLRTSAHLRSGAVPSVHPQLTELH